MKEEVLKCIPSVKLTNPVLKGDDGGYYIPNVSEEGKLSWTPTEQDMPKVEAVNVKGPAGKDGKTPVKGVDYFDGKNGIDGVSPNATVKQTETGATVVIQDKYGTTTANLSNGKDGARGPAGEQGPIGKQGPVGERGPAGADATINGVNTLTLAQGENITLDQVGDTITISAIGGDITTPTHTTMNVEFQKDGFGNFTADKNDNDINNHRNGGGLVQAKYTDDNGITYTYYYSNMESDRKPTFIRTYIEDGKTKQVLASVGNDKKVSVERRETNVSADVPIATTAIAGKVKPDGTTITVTEDGTISSIGGGGGKTYTFKGGLTENPEGTVGLDIAYFACSGEPLHSMCIGTYENINNIKSREAISIGDTNYINSKCTDAPSENIAIGSINEINNKKDGNPSAQSIVIGNGNKSNTSHGYAFGEFNEVNAQYAMAYGFMNKASSAYQTAMGRQCVEDTANTYAYIYGIGVSNFANGFTLDWSGNGTFAGKVSSTGADYAEYFEWLDSNPEAEDRVGYIVALDGNKIRKANNGDDVLGVISGTVGVLGDDYEWNWQGKYLTDDFGRVIYDMVEEFDEDPETHEKHSLGFFPHPRLNPEYNPDEKYVNRAERREWDAVGMMGKLFVRDDGTANVGDYVEPANGIATVASGRTNMRVMERIKPNIIRICLK